ncbi:NAD 5'-nucleotidase [Vibrio stylophorae]|uniref:NAD 5'-nucleotidase n=1 Tax=Vibrio stylophorae TaxID=659351 RepID=A0ABM8ZUH7_9VIBR|nr:bifunctional metallophosphatase/5'-nucleotidase [Vibrio stylophorae]CAH0533987.1 NAD 5'-nucleotidase [Vibrio stylophorae]
MTFSKPLSALALALLLAGCGPAPQEQPFTLTIAHINDTHSNFDPVKSSFDAKGQRVYNEFGGYPRLQAMAQQLAQAARRDNLSFLFLHGGDAWQGSAYFKLNEGVMNADLLSDMGLDAMALGNHEFDLNNAKLNTFLASINFPVVAANVDASQDPDLKNQHNLKPYVVFAFDGNEKTPVTDLDHLPKGKEIVAVFGLALEDMPNLSPNTGKVQFHNLVKSAQETVDFLESKGIDQIIALTHIGNAVDLDVASKVNGIDVIVGGHSHTLLGDFANLGMENAGTYAEMVQNPNGQGETCVVQAGQYAQAIGEMSVSFDAKGEVIQCAGTNILLSNDEFFSSPMREPSSALKTEQTKQVEQFIDQQNNIKIVDEDKTMRAHIDSTYKPAVVKAYGDVIARVPETIHHARRPGDAGSDKHGSDVAPIIAEGQYFWANTPEVQALTGMKVDFALIGAGGVRTNFEPGEYREGDMALEMLPFSNFMSVMPVKGAVIKQLLQDTISATLAPGAHAGKFPYGGHLRYQFTETEPGKAGKLDFVEVMTGDASNPTWTPIKDDQTYVVAINNYNATGNDGWRALFDAQKDGTKRVDIAYVDGKLAAFAVKNVQEKEGKFVVNYLDQVPDCKADNVRCNTDAQAVIDYIAAEQPVLQPLNYEVVTLNRAK